MCGVAGLVAPPGLVQRDVLSEMLATLSHRGPDGQFTAEFPTASMGMRRLNVLDFEGGVQPFFSEDGSVCVVFNGEIYDAPHWRRALLAKGHSFSSRCADGEILPHMYEEFGADFVFKLEGMFAIAVWDDSRKLLHLARDAFGIKPLFYARSGQVTSFASEIRALHRIADAQLEASAAAIDNYIRLGHVPGPATIFKGILQVPPASVVTFAPEQPEMVRTWRPDARDWRSCKEADARDAVESILESSVAAQVQADAPLGVFLSGGLDSSLVAAMASKYRAMQSFTLTFPDAPTPGKQLDAKLASDTATRLGLAHTEVPVTSSGFLAGLPEVVRAMEQPFAGAISTYYLSAIASQQVTVALTGDGADELFGSYWSHRIAAFLDWIGARDDYSGAGSLWEFPDHASWGLSRTDLMEAAQCRSVDDIRAVTASRHSPYGSDLYSPHFLEALAADSLVPSPQQSNNWSQLATIMQSDRLGMTLAQDRDRLLVDEVLTFVDRLSMWHSLELRPPFLNRELVQVVAGMPAHWLIRPGSVKALLADVAGRWLPEDVIRRNKEGFVQPLSTWLIAPLWSFVNETLSPERLRLHGFWNDRAVRDRIDTFGRNPSRDYKKVWSLVMFQLWWETQYQ